MVRTLKLIVNWLEKRFPEKIVFNIEEYNKLLKRLEVLEADNNKFNIELGFRNALNHGQRTPFQR